MNSSPLYGGLKLEDWISLSFLTGIGPARLSRLYTYLSELNDLIQKEKTGSVDHSSEITYDLLQTLKWPDQTIRQAMSYLSSGVLTTEQKQKKDETLEWLSLPNHHLIFRDDASYPNTLREIAVAPSFLYIEGTVSALTFPKIGMVGARKCSYYGRECSFQLAEQLSSRGICVVSGGARGIDTAAHQGALQANTTPTIAVMGTGLFHYYPKQNRSLFHKIVEQNGCLVSEYPLMTNVRSHLFPPRNRIISGLSMGVLVAEASIKSGSLISAHYALQQNRDVFALPGRLTDPQSEGCLQLLRQGAILVRHADDIFAEYPALSHKKEESPIETSLVLPSEPICPLPSHLSSDAASLANRLEAYKGPLDFDALVRQTNLHTSELMQALMELELCGCIENSNGLYKRC